jgi:hypothetical protein
MIIQKQEPPPRWASDDLTTFIQMATDNIAATFHNKKNAFNILKDIDSYFLIITDHLLNAPDFLASLFLFRTHSAYRAACRLSLSGQVPETFVLLRSCIEYPLYALHINGNPELGEKWIDRHKDEESFKSVRNEFQYGRVIKTLETIDPAICRTSKLLYERSIDFGAHPNERSITSSMKVIKGRDRIEYKQIYLAQDSKQLSHGLKSTAQVGLCALYIFRHIFKERFDILGITQKMDQYRDIL